MNKQKEIREGLEGIIHVHYHIDPELQVGKILKYLDKSGVVIKVDRELPHLMPEVPNNEFSRGYCAGERNILNILIEMDYINAVEPLIKEE